MHIAIIQKVLLVITGALHMLELTIKYTIGRIMPVHMCMVDTHTITRKTLATYHIYILAINMLSESLNIITMIIMYITIK